MELAFGFLGWIIFGGIAGWLASKVMKTDEQMGVWANIGAGVAGGLIGGAILGFVLGAESAGFFWSFVTSFVGACLVIGIIKAVKGRK
ncbi:membrane protein [Lawsonella clevelandensis]|uniref:GlsB/YeaQ/YmgE family stress response membrane protein n=1 Tax=Lawsonella clevelandensis TaxID=1528099 RepID=UPI0006B41407|nr:GlsB/YeaQ/YmgE family stress response membrane protein [Lawsonella clevelandensis]ALE34844.1 membrane protein [Lawsonella clevelandensis]